jgi:hypothetical protein
MFAVGDKVTDKDGIVGIVTETRIDGTWIRYKCRPNAHLCELLSGNIKKYKRIRYFWIMHTNLKKI